MLPLNTILSQLCHPHPNSHQSDPRSTGQGQRADLRAEQAELINHRGADQLPGQNENTAFLTPNDSAGSDFLRVGAGADTLVFSVGQDRVIGFKNKNVIDLSHVASITIFEDLIANHLTGTKDAVITDDSGNSLAILDVSMTSLEQDDFLF